jgi:hypothetical protein
VSSLDGRLSDATALASRSYVLERTILYATLTSLPREALDPGKGCHEQATNVREEVERRFPASGIRERLLARRR